MKHKITSVTQLTVGLYLVEDEAQVMYRVVQLFPGETRFCAEDGAGIQYEFVQQQADTSKWYDCDSEESLTFHVAEPLGTPKPAPAPKTEAGKYLLRIRENARREVTDLEHMKDMTTAAVTNLEAMLPALTKAMADEGLALEVNSIAKTGFGDQSSRQWLTTDRLNVSITLTPTNGKFKFLNFRGYNSRGESLNAKAKRDKESKLALALKAATTKAIEVQVHGVELGNHHSRRVVFGNVWVKP